MKKFKPLPIGVKSFKRIIDKNYYLVDKTLFIKDIIDSGTSINLFTRPRRFGKTLNLSMIQCFFEKTEHDNSYLFNDLNISKAGEEYLSHMGQYPVINLSLKSMKQNSYTKSFALFKKIIADEFKRHNNILQFGKLTKSEIKKYQLICDENADEIVYLYSIRFLCDCLKVSYNKNVVILIDEYDVPLEAAYFGGFYDEMVDLIRSAFEGVLKTNLSLEFAVLTGCLRISKESIFTGLNNLNVYTVTDNLFSQYFGFTEKEVHEIANFYGVSDKFYEIKKWYDGYLFGETEIYNPWSVLKYIQSSITSSVVIPESYWSNTSSNDIIRELVFKGDEETKNMIEELMNSGTVSVPLYSDITYRNVNINTDYIWSFLLYTGYLKPVRVYKEKNNLTYFDGVIPNIEIQTIYQTTIMQWFNEKVSSESRTDLFQALINGDSKQLEEILCDWLESTISYYDGKENYYHGFLSGLLSGFTGYTVKSNRESGTGRPDILILERRRHKIGVIIEIKVTEKFRDLDKKCDEALQQIEDKNYESELIEDCYQKIIKYGIAFYEKSCMVKMK